mmetsp:Transcript_31812/g.71305  ORF Transcript_31812/g.71305 Transcript_31812/m.71305 type:complete len:284 (+) Transcript_31812:262-1113(+)
MGTFPPCRGSGELASRGPSPGRPIGSGSCCEAAVGGWQPSSWTLTSSRRRHRESERGISYGAGRWPTWITAYLTRQSPPWSSAFQSPRMRCSNCLPSRASGPQATGVFWFSVPGSFVCRVIYWATPRTTMSRRWPKGTGSWLRWLCTSLWICRPRQAGTFKRPVCKKALTFSGPPFPGSSGSPPARIFCPTPGTWRTPCSPTGFTRPARWTPRPSASKPMAGTCRCGLGTDLRGSSCPTMSLLARYRRPTWWRFPTGLTGGAGRRRGWRRAAAGRRTGSDPEA